MRLPKSVMSLLQIICMACVAIFAIPFTIIQENDPKSIYRIASSGDQRLLAVSYRSYGHRSTVDFFDKATGQLISSVDLSPEIVSNIALSPTGDRLLFANPSGDTISIYDRNANKTTQLINFISVGIDVIGWNPANDEVAYGLGRAVNVLDAKTGTFLYSIYSGGTVVVSLAWSWDGTKLATSHFFDDPSGTHKTISTATVWDLSSRQEDILTTPSLVIQDRGGGSIAWSPDGRRLALTEAQNLLIYDVESNQIEADLPINSESFYKVAWNKTGDRLATGGSIIRIWNTHTWEVEQTITLDEPVSNLEWSFDGQYVFSDGSSDRLSRDEISAPIVIFQS
jgi:WD40 repeat protein